MPEMDGQPLAWLAYRTTKGTADAASKILQGQYYLHHGDLIPPDTTPIFVAEAHTQLDVLLLPRVLQQFSGKDVLMLMPALGSVDPRAIPDVIVTEHPDPDKIVRSLLQGTHAWVAVDVMQRGGATPIGHWLPFRAHSEHGRVPIPPAVAELAVRAEWYRWLLQQNGRLQDEHLDELLRHLRADPQIQEAGRADAGRADAGRRFVLVPVKLNYFPAPPPLPADTGNAPLELPGVAETAPLPEADVDVVFGKPVELNALIDKEESANAPLPSAPPPGAPPPGGPLLPPSEAKVRAAAARVLGESAKAEGRLGVLHAGHILAGIVTRSWRPLMSERELRHRVFFAAMGLSRQPELTLQGGLMDMCLRMLEEETVPAFDRLIDAFMRSGLLRKHDRQYARGRHWRQLPADMPARVFIRELRAVPEADRVVARAARMPHGVVARRVRQWLAANDQRIFREDYDKHFQDGVSKDRDVGAPFLLKPLWPIGGVVLIHGYMAAPLEVRALADFLYQRQYAVYGVRLRGHGTAPSDLGTMKKEDWYASIRRGFSIMRTITEEVVIGGFSMGAGLALLTAGQRKSGVKAVFAINTPLHLRNTAARFAPSVKRVNALLRRFNIGGARWEYLENDPENKHINYTSNPVTGVAELRDAMLEMQEHLKHIGAPALVLQGSRDPVVHPDSGPAIFDQIGTPEKELVVLERNTHGIVNGPRSKEVFERVWQFLTWARTRNRER